MEIAVLGAGVMGHGIAQVCAMAGHTVALRDVERGPLEGGLADIRGNLEEGIERGKVTPRERDGTVSRMVGTTDLEDAVSGADLVVEAVPEDLDVKRETFAEVEAAAPEDAVIATNTSSLSVTAIANALSEPDRALGLHFFNPPYVLDLVEVVVGERTAEETVSFAESFVDGIGKMAITVRDSPGFATSRLGVAQAVEAMRIVEEGVADPADVDRAMELGYDHPMGPLELTDHVGLDVRLDILEYLNRELGTRFRPPQILKRKVRGGRLGRKSGEGFYVWEDGEIVRSVS